MLYTSEIKHLELSAAPISSPSITLLSTLSIVFSSKFLLNRTKGIEIGFFVYFVMQPK
jgi:hypothetical protein